MDCRYAEKLMMKYMDGEISEEEARELNKHILVCENCREEFFVYDRMITEAEAVSAEEITAPEGFEEAVMMKIRAEKTPVYGYSKNDKIRAACVGTCGLFFAVSYFLVINQQAVISKMYRYPVFEQYLNKMVPFARSMEVYAGRIVSMINNVVLQADRILSSMGIAILGLIVVFCMLQAVVYTRKNRRR